MKLKIGSNQHKVKKEILSAKCWASVWFIAFMTTMGIWLSQPKIVSPCPDSGCLIVTMYLKESPSRATIRDRVLLAAIHEFGVSHAYAIDALLMKESTYNNYAVNPSSGACGLFQSLPCSKMRCELSDVDCQIKWGMSYIKKRYGNPIQAWLFWQDRAEENKKKNGKYAGWY